MPAVLGHRDGDEVAFAAEVVRFDQEVDELEQSLDSVRADVLTGRLARRTTQPSRLVVVGIK